MLRARLLCALLGTCAWGYWWFAVQRLSARDAFLLWVSTLALWLLAFVSTWPVPRPSRTTAWTAVVLALLLIPRTVWLTDIPYTFTVDEVSYPLQGLDALRDHPWEIISRIHEWYIPHLGEVLQAWPCLFFEPIFGARLASVLLAILSLASTYALAGRLFGRVTASVAGIVLACSYWHMAYSRTGYPYMQPMAWVPLTLYVLAVGADEHNRFLQFVGGVLLGASALLYTPARIVIPIAGAWFAHRLLVNAVGRRAAAISIAVVALGALIFLSPHLQHYGTQMFFRRYELTAMSGAGTLAQLHKIGWISREGRELLASQVRAATRPYYARDGWLAVNDFATDPLLDRVTLALAILGLGVAAIRPADSGRFLLLVWVVATFILGQVFTEIPASAYRAAPVLPALAICAGLASSTLAASLQRWRRLDHPAVGVAALLALIAALLPANLRYLQNYLTLRSRNAQGGIARIIGTGSPAAVYYLVGQLRLSQEPIFHLVGRGKTILDLPALTDSLGADIDATRDAVFVLQPSMTEAAAAIRRCYPAAVTLHEPSGPRDEPVLALRVSQPAVAAGRGCAAAQEGPGLRARYFSGANWDGALVLERIEDWPVRFQQDPKRFSSIEWSGFLLVPIAGTYHFQLWGALAAGVATIGPSLQVSLGDAASAHLDAGLYPLTIRCRPEQETGTCWLRWDAPGGPWAAIPTTLLRPSPRHEPVPLVDEPIGAPTSADQLP